MGSIDFDSEPAYWYISTMRDSKKAGLPVRSRPAVNRGETLQAQEVRRRVERLAYGYRASVSHAFEDMVNAAHTCAACQTHFTRREWRERRLWRVIYPREGGRIEVFRHTICPKRGE